MRNGLAGMPGFEGIGGARVPADYEDFQRWHIQPQCIRGFSDDDTLDYSTVEFLSAMIEWRDNLLTAVR